MAASVLLGAAVVVCAGSAGTASAQRTPVSPTFEVLYAAHRYDAGIVPARGVTLSTAFSSQPGAEWRLTTMIEDRFGEPGFSYRGEHARDFGAWFGRAALQTSSGGFYNARFRADVQAGRKLLADRSLLLAGGIYHRSGRDGHEDTGFSFDVQNYLPHGIVAQAGVRSQRSNPGGAWSSMFDAALMWVQPGKRQLTLHGYAGRESYEVIDPLTIYVDFASRGARLSMRQWIGRDTGFTAAASWYGNEYYRRAGFEAGFFVGLDR